MAKEIRYKCGECGRRLARRIPHRCNGVFQQSDEWEKVTVDVKYSSRPKVVIKFPKLKG